MQSKPNYQRIHDDLSVDPSKHDCVYVVVLQ